MLGFWNFFLSSTPQPIYSQIFKSLELKETHLPISYAHFPQKTQRLQVNSYFFKYLRTLFS